MNAELIQRVKNEAALMVFREAKFDDRDFGFDFDPTDPEITFKVSSMVVGAARLHYNFSGLSKLFLPSYVKEMIEINHLCPHGQVDLGMVHYGINQRQFRKSINRFCENGRIFNDQNLIDEKQLLDWFNDRFASATCLYNEVWYENHLIGQKELMRQVVGELKQDPAEIFELMRGLTNHDTSRQQVKIRAYHLYDLVDKPREVHLMKP